MYIKKTIARFRVNERELDILYHGPGLATRPAHGGATIDLGYLACTHSVTTLSSSSVPTLAFASDSLSSSNSISRASKRSTKRSSGCGCARTRRPIGSAVVDAISPGEGASVRAMNWVCRRNRISPVVSSREVSQKSSLQARRFTS